MNDWKNGLTDEQISAVNDHIKSTIGERLKNKSAELTAAQDRISELEGQAVSADVLKTAKEELATIKNEKVALQKEYDDMKTQVSNLQTKNNDYLFDAVIAKYKFSEKDNKILRKVLDPNAENLDDEIQKLAKEYGLIPGNALPNETQNPATTTQAGDDADIFSKLGSGMYK